MVVGNQQSNFAWLGHLGLLAWEKYGNDVADGLGVMPIDPLVLLPTIIPQGLARGKRLILNGETGAASDVRSRSNRDVPRPVNSASGCFMSPACQRRRHVQPSG